MLKKAAAIILSIAMVLFIVASPSGAALTDKPDVYETAGESSVITHEADTTRIAAKGMCGKNAHFELHDSSILYIYGEGEIFDYNEPGSETKVSPFYSFYFESVVIEEGITRIGTYTFAYTDAIHVDLPDSLTFIGAHAFEHCKNLYSVYMPDSITDIGEYAFFKCETMKVLKLSDKLTSISAFAFGNCSFITRIIIPDSIKTINYAAFQDNYSITDIYYTGTQDNWTETKIKGNNNYLKNAEMHYQTNISESLPCSENAYRVKLLISGYAHYKHEDMIGYQCDRNFKSSGYTDTEDQPDTEDYDENIRYAFSEYVDDNYETWSRNPETGELDKSGAGSCTFRIYEIDYDDEYLKDFKVVGDYDSIKENNKTFTISGIKSDITFIPDYGNYVLDVIRREDSDSEPLQEPDEDNAYKVTLNDPDNMVSYNVYYSSYYSEECEESDVDIAWSRDSDSKQPRKDGYGNCSFEIVLNADYELYVKDIQITGSYENCLRSILRPNKFEIENIKSNLTVTPIFASYFDDFRDEIGYDEPTEENAYKITFEDSQNNGEHTSYDVFYKYNSEQPDETDVHEAWSRDGITGQPDKSGNGECTFSAEYEGLDTDGGSYLKGVTVTGNYDSLEKHDNYDGFKYTVKGIKGDLTVTPVYGSKGFETGLMGDIDGDCNITAKDSLAAQRAVINLNKLDDKQKQLADVNNDEKVDNRDCIDILRYSIGIKVKSKVGETIYFEPNIP